MKLLNVIESILFIVAIIYIFIDWKISILLFIIFSVIHAIPYGPNILLSVITGFLIISGVIYIFINWKIALVLIISAFLVTKFRIWSNRANYEFYKNKE